VICPTLELHKDNAATHKKHDIAHKTKLVEAHNREIDGKIARSKYIIQQTQQEIDELRAKQETKPSPHVFNAELDSKISS